MSKKPARRRLLAALADEARQIRTEFSNVNSALGRVDCAHQSDGRLNFSLDAPTSAAATQRVHSIRRRAMACWFEVLLPVDQPQWTAAAAAALDEVDRVELMLSIYRPDSELSILNRDAARAPVRTTPDLAAFLTLCRLWYERTGGAFDPAAGALVELWGFKDRRPRRPTDAEIQAARLRSGFERVRFHFATPIAESGSDRAAGSMPHSGMTTLDVSFDAPGSSRNRARQEGGWMSSAVQLAKLDPTPSLESSAVVINPGAIGKGWAIDRAAQILTDRGGDNFLIQAGGSSVLARGIGPDKSNSHDGGWLVAVPGASPVRLLNRALATSGSDEQFFEHDGIRFSHIIDPRTGYASTRTGTLTVQAPDASSAEAASTALFVMSPDEQSMFLAANPALRLVSSPPVVTRR